VTAGDAAGSTIMLIRHGEKPPHSGRPHGVTPEGTHDGHSLTVEGWVRAGALMELFAPSRCAPTAPVRRPDRIYAASPHGGQSKRSVQTVMPLAIRLGLDVISRFAEGEEKALAHELGGQPGVALVAWHHQHMPTLLRHLGPVAPAPPEHWPDDRFDMVWVVTRDGGQWRFEQVAQLLLPGDLDLPIAG
jgi:hypothetical protein